MNTQKIWGLILFAFGSLLYTLNQTVQMLLFANAWSEFIFTIICYIIISIGIAMFLFESDSGTQTIIGFFSIIITIFVLNASLLIYDSFNAFRYSSTDYLILFEYANNLGTITDEIALTMIAIAPTLGIIFWMLISRKDLVEWYYFTIFIVAIFFETWIFAALQSISIF